MFSEETPWRLAAPAADADHGDVQLFVEASAPQAIAGTG